MPATATRTEEVPAHQVAAMLAAKASQLDAWQRTIRNGLRAARRDGCSYYVGFTSLAYFLVTDPTMGGAYRYEATADGRLYRMATAA